MTEMTSQADKAFRHPWIGVEMRHLATLSAVARSGSFRQAARELGYVQSAVSQQVAHLEQVVGARLVERRRGQRNVRLTRVGEVLAERADRILGELHAARVDLSTSDSATDDAIRLAIDHDLAPLLARVLAAMGDDLSTVPIQVTEIAGEMELVRRLERGEADVAIGVPVAASGVASVILLQDPFVLLAMPDSHLAGMRSISTPADLRSERLIVPTSVHSHGQIHAREFLLDRALRVPLAAAVAPLVAQGHGVGLVPRSVAEAATELVRIPTVGLLAPHRVVLGWHAGRRRSARLGAFCDIAIRALADDAVEERARAA